MIISLIAALTRNLVIGNEQGIPWHIPHDLKRFRALTWGKPIVMGRRTFETLRKPLPGRPNIVLTRDAAFRPEGVHVATGPFDALAAAERLLRQSGGDEVMVIGGEQVYRIFLPWARRLYLSLVEGEYPGTAFFPERLPGQPDWHVTRREHSPLGVGIPVPYTFFLLEQGEPERQSTAALLSHLLADA